MPNNPFSSADPVKAVIRLRRGPEVDRIQSVYDDGEIVWSTDKQRAFVGNGADTGGVIISNKVWVVDNFQKLPNIEINDCVFRTDTNAFYVLTGYNYLMENNYILVGGSKLITNNTSITQGYILPNATDSQKGGVIIGSGLYAANGVINIEYDDTNLDIVNNKLTVKNIASPTVNTGHYVDLGIVRVVQDSGLKINSGAISVLYDDDTIKLKDFSGVKKLYADFSAITPIDTFKMVNSNITLTTKTLSVYETDGLTLGNDGKLVLNTASFSNIGGVKIGSNSISIVTDGIIDVKTDNTTIKPDNNGSLYVNTTELSGTVGLSGFASSNGWQLFPNGVIMQWGTSDITSSTTGSVSFPQPHKSSVYTITATHSTNNGAVSAIAVKSITTNGFTAEIALSGTLSYYWQSIGF